TRPFISPHPLVPKGEKTRSAETRKKRRLQRQRSAARQSRGIPFDEERDKNRSVGRRVRGPPFPRVQGKADRKGSESREKYSWIKLHLFLFPPYLTLVDPQEPIRNSSHHRNIMAGKEYCQTILPGQLN